MGETFQLEHTLLCEELTMAMAVYPQEPFPTSGQVEGYVTYMLEEKAHTDPDELNPDPHPFFVPAKQREITETFYNDAASDNGMDWDAIRGLMTNPIWLPIPNYYRYFMSITVLDLNIRNAFSVAKHIIIYSTVNLTNVLYEFVLQPGEVFTLDGTYSATGALKVA
jgi:hypothetical protein